jgi:hypothetical protein
MENILHWLDEYRSLRLFLRSILVIPWQIAGWWIVITCLRRKQLAVQHIQSAAQLT